MELEIKEYKIERVEVGTKTIKIPTETEYYFESGSRKSIKIEPFLDKSLETLKFTIVKTRPNECSIEVFDIPLTIIEKIYYSKTDTFKIDPILKNLIDGFLNKRTSEQFESDLTSALTLITK